MVPGATGEWDEVIIAAGSVVFHDETYHIWYWGGDIEKVNQRIGHATSVDGINWSKDLNNPVLEPGPDGAWDGTAVGDPTVIYSDSVFHMWYEGIPKLSLSEGMQIGHATSPDGIHWTKDAENPVLEMGASGEWDDEWVSQPEVLTNGSEYHMWYGGDNKTIENFQIGHATSPDGTTWIKDAGNPVMSRGASGDWDYPRVDFPKVIFDGTSYHMWYSGGAYYAWNIGYATSEDGSAWTKYVNNPVLLNGTSGTWDAVFAAFSPVLDSAGIKFKMWYSGGSNIYSSGIGYAYSDTRDPYLLVLSNKPVYDSNDTIVAEIVLDGTIYIIPEGTSQVVDSIIKHKVVSVEASANTEVQLSLTGLSIGKYTVIAVSLMGFVSTTPSKVELVHDAAPPDLTLAEDSVSMGETIVATSTKDGRLFLVNKGTPRDLSYFLMLIYRKDSITVKADIPVEISTAGLSVNDYWIYAVDIYGFISNPVTVTVLDTVTMVENIDNAEISIYPNPAKDLIIIETNREGQYSIKLNSTNGQLLYRDEMEGSSHQIDLSTFQKGVYFITIRSKDFLATMKIIKL